MTKSAQIFFGIKEIRESAFSIDDSVEFVIGSSYSCRYNANIHSATEEETITITIDSSFWRKDNQMVFMTGKCSTKFAIQNMKKISRRRNDGDEVIDLPNEIWVTLFSLAYSHARALLAKSSAGTKFSSVLLPLIDPQQAFNTLFATELAKKE